MTLPEAFTGLKTNNPTKHLDLGVQGVSREMFFTFEENPESTRTC